ncbi:MAG: NADH:ubiquinone reductase (Na(+)-transporting) subunit F [Cytophagales bacterium]|nr:NADH:ubiquinone reductase (Na(+)-transporting) subunit F [Cytophagales bacterium]
MFITLTSAIISFTLVILILVLIVLYVQSKLVQQGNVTIIVNDDESKKITTNAGSTLLSTLAAQNLFLPSACGGGGTCALCKCVVEDGGGDVLPTEVGFLTRTEQLEKVRLSCQVKVKQDMNIRIPEEVFGIKKWECTVVSNDNVSTFIKELVVKLPEGEFLKFDSGHYIQIDVPECEVNYKNFDIDNEYHADWDKFNMWDLTMKNGEPEFRAYSMANHPAEGNIMKFDIRIATPPWDREKGNFMEVNPGVCSSYTFDLKPGDKITISGPYGDFFIKDTETEMIYIGGGAGMAPLRSHIFHLFHTQKTKRKVSFWYGGRSLRELFYTDEYRKIEKKFPNFTYQIALSEPLPEDNWKGYTGFIHQVVLDNYLSKHPEPEEVEYYLCGPPMMNEAVLKMLDDMGVPSENIAFDDFGI